MGLMVFLPKKVAGVDPDHGEYYTCADTRPLMLINVDVRLCANVIRRKAEPILQNHISENQQGFLHGRSMISNVVDVEHAAQAASLHHNRAAILLLDLRAAFPSVNPAFIHHMLKQTNVPEHIRNIIGNFYVGHHCNLSVGGQDIRWLRRGFWH